MPSSNIKRLSVRLFPGGAKGSTVMVENNTLDFEELQVRFDVEGFLSPLEGYALMLFAAGVAAVGETVEIGSFMGRSTCWLAEGVRRAGLAAVTAIDHFSGSPEHQQHGKDECSAIVERGTTFDEFMANLRRAGVAEWVKPVRASSVEAVQQWDAPIRLLFIDGDHSYEGVKQDFSAWSPFVTPGGVVCFHDIGVWDGPSRFYGELMAAGSGWQEVLSVASLRAAKRDR